MSDALYFVDTLLAIKQYTDGLFISFLCFQNHLATSTAGRVDRSVDKVFLGTCSDGKCHHSLVGILRVGIK